MVVLIYLLYLPLGILQILAFAAGLHVWLGISVGLGFVIAFFFGPWPILGTVLGMVGAHSAWGWSWPASFLLFFGPFILLLAVSVIGETGSELSSLLSRFWRKR